MLRKHGAFFAALGAVLALAAQVFLLLDCLSLASLPWAHAIALTLLGAVVATLSTLSGVLCRRIHQQQAAAQRGQFYLLSHFSNTFLFEYRFRARILSFSDNLPKELGLEVQLEGSHCSARLRQLVHPDDLPKLCNVAASPPTGRKEVGVELRLLHRGGAYVWYECRMVATYDKHGRPTTLLGRFENIDTRKRREANLVARSTRDDLTGLLNRSAVTLRVEEWIQSPRAAEGGALFMLDLDNFKSINDTQGHATGDRALLLTARVLRETFRGTDILGRAGGDEFLVFMTGVSSPEVAADRAEALCRAMAQRSDDTNPEAAFTCSVGISLFPLDGRTYPDLFEAADAAMYQAKREGKNSYRLCSSLSDLIPGA